MRIPLRPAPLVAPLLVGLVAYGYVASTETPTPMLALVGGGTTPLDVRGGIVVEVTPPAGASSLRRWCS